MSGWLSDGGAHRGRRTRPRGHWTGTRLTDVPARLGLAEGGHAHCRLSGQGQDEQAAWLAVAGWLGAWSGAGRWRCPPLGRRRPDRSVPIGAVTLNWGGPADRTVERSAMSVARSAHCRMFAGGTDRRRRCPGRVSGGRTLAEAGAQTDCAHVRQGTGEVLEVPTRRSRVGCAGRRAAPARKPAPATDRVDGRVWRRVGHRVSVAAPVRRRWPTGGLLGGV